MGKGFMALTLGVCFIWLAGCGATAGNPATTTLPVNSSPGTMTSGPVVIATDHSVYAPTDAIHITVTNHLAAAIYAYDHQASCSILNLEMQQGSSWQMVRSPIAGCPLGSPTVAVAVAPNMPYQADVRAGYLRQGDQSFSLGTYRLVLAYATTPLRGSGGATPTFTTVYSSPLTINTQYQPQPIPTTASGSGAGTATAGTAVPVGTTQP
jgi:hypothetical protein